MKKFVSNNLTSGILSKKFKHRVKELIAEDKAFSFMSSIKGIAAYWKLLHHVLVMVKQLGTPAFFSGFFMCLITIERIDIYSIIVELNGIDIADEDIDRVSYRERCDIFNKNPVIVARHFQYRVEMLFKVTVLDGPPEKT